MPKHKDTPKQKGKGKEKSLPASTPTLAPQNSKKGKLRSNSTAAQVPTSPNPIPAKGKGRSMSTPIIPSTKKNTNPHQTPPSQLPSSWPQDPTSLIDVRPSLLKRFYEALVILFILGKNRGTRVDEEEHEYASSSSSEINPEKLRRGFTRSLAYLCDFEKGGARTTAIALEEGKGKIVFWMASNISPNNANGNDAAKSFLEQILKQLRGVRKEHVERVENELFGKCVKFSKKRIGTYIDLLEGPVEAVLRSLESQVDEDPVFISWLRDLQTAMSSPQTICRFCFDCRERWSQEYNNLQSRAQLGFKHAGHYDKIRHLIGRLNHTLKAIKIIIEASVNLPFLLSNFEVKRIKSSHASPPPLQERNPSLYQILGRMTDDPRVLSENSPYRLKLQSLDQQHNLSQALSNQCRDRNWKPRVHAELLLLHHFWINKLTFVSGDRYIACSKPACYCCYQYIRAHPGGFVSPACHNNNWVNWRAPDVTRGEGEVGVRARERVLNDMVKVFRDEAFEQIRERRGPVRAGPDSLTEISGVRRSGLGFASGGRVATVRSGDRDRDEDVSEGSEEEEESYGEESVDEEVASDACSRGSRSESEDESEDDDEEGGVSLFAFQTI